MGSWSKLDPRNSNNNVSEEKLERALKLNFQFKKYSLEVCLHDQCWGCTYGGR